MVRAEKIVARMRRNPRDWRIADLRAIADRHGIEHRQPGTSHVTFSFAGVEPLTVPAHKPIKPIYVRRFLRLLDAVLEASDG